MNKEEFVAKIKDAYEEYPSSLYYTMNKAVGCFPIKTLDVKDIVEHLINTVINLESESSIPYPPDRDGIPCKPGDRLYDKNGNAFTITGMQISFDIFFNPCYEMWDDSRAIAYKEMSHTKPRTITDIKSDAIDKIPLWLSFKQEARDAIWKLVEEAYELGIKAGKDE